MPDEEPINVKLIHSLARMMKRTDLSELEVDDSQSGLRVHLIRGGREGASGALVNVMQGGGATAAAPSAAGPPQVGAPAAAAGPEAALPPGTVHFKSPMVGTFYRSSSPDSDPFVSVGAKVNDESVICIIEAMKVMNEIKAELNGKIVEILVENAEPIEFGQPLFLIQKG